MCSDDSEPRVVTFQDTLPAGLGYSEPKNINPSGGDAPGVKGNVSWIFLGFAFGGLSKQFGRAHFVVFSF